MSVYWQYVRRGQNLIFSSDEGQEERIGGFRETRRGIDAYATTFGYDPGRSEKGFPSIEDAKAFVESFRPWELYGAHGVTVEPEVRPGAESAGTTTTETPESPEEPAEEEPPPEPAASIPEPGPEPAAPFSDPPPKKSWWGIWKRN